MTTSRRRLDRVAATLSPPETLGALCARAAERAGLDAGWVEAEARRILEAAPVPGEAVRLAVADLAAASGRPVAEVAAEIAAAAAELAA